MSETGDNDQLTWDPAVLRALRTERGWSIAEAARQLRMSADQPLPGHDSLVKAWKRWEHGTEPSRFYGPLLSRLLAAPDPTSRCGIVTAYPRRALIPPALWDELLRDAHQEIWMLQYAGLFLPEQQPDLLDLLTATAQAGTRVRLLFGDPDCLAVTTRSYEEAIGGRSIPAEIRNTLRLYGPLTERVGVDVRLHMTTLYSSVYRFDDHMLVAHHVYGLPAAQAPVLQLGRGELFDTYVRCFDRIWDEAKPMVETE
jgi:hypothetical protein